MDKEATPVITVAKTARLLGVTAPTAYEWVRQGELPSIRLGGRIRIPIAKLADLLGLSHEEMFEMMGSGDGSA
jgi:excisionase family DNA binding protein